MKKKSKAGSWPEDPMRDELKIGIPGSGCVATIYPKKNHAGSLKEIDVIHLELENGKGQSREFWMTPDEALEISGVLSHAVMAFLNFKFEPYQKIFNTKRNELTAKHAEKSKKKKCRK